MSSRWRGGMEPRRSSRPGAGEPGTDGPPPERVARAAGCRVWDEAGREYVDYVMALGAVALGYGHPAVNRAAEQAIAAGVVGPLPPPLEEELAEALCRDIPWIEAVRFLKTGAEAVAAAVRLARVATGRDLALGCGYHGWLDWCQGGGIEGVPAATRALYAELPFNDSERTRQQIREAGDRLAGVVVEPGVVEEPAREGRRAAPGGAGPPHLHRVGTGFLHGLHRLQREHAGAVAGVGGVAEMCFLHYASDDVSRAVARACAARGVLFKRTAYNFVSLAHDEATVDRTLDVLDDVLRSVVDRP